MLALTLGRTWRAILALGAPAAAALALLVVGLAKDDRCRSAACLPAGPCEATSLADRNPADATVAPTRGKRLMPRTPEGTIPFGFNDSAYLAGQVDLETAVRLHRGSGSSIWRLPLDWGAVERAPGAFDFSEPDRIYCNALAAGIRPLFHLTGVPLWASDPPEACLALPCVRPPAAEHLPALRRFAEIVAIRYPRLAAVEAWNEPNLRDFWPAPDPARYAELLEAIYTGVKNGDPTTAVIGGSLSSNPTDDGATGSLSLGTFLSGMAAAGAQEHMDALSVHPYPLTALDAPEERFTSALGQTRKFMREAEGWPDRLWVTETGIATVPGSPFSSPVSEDEQARTLLAIHRRLSRSSDVDAVLFHTLVDPSALIPGGPGFGWVTDPAQGLRPKPVYCAFSAQAEAVTDAC